ncbi:hypothetical protein [Erythrobacter ani]|uniref:Argininosuccinate lyase n=1 Tax=Erythrobacter ani TaxID=2827235 RepID=A0ABS6SJ44_9SPHN|nr:hypothetical protein [Erythrobacter ani]MBV7265025.1 hypothetical protein [Erythrobacter ani]
MMTRPIIALAAFSLLAACGSDEPVNDSAAVDQEGQLRGDVLGGSISDDMLPLDQLTSQSPPLETAADSDTATSSDAGGDSTDDSEQELNAFPSGGDDPAPPAPPEPPAVQDEGE